MSNEGSQGTAAIARGLEGVVVATSELSFIDGQEGILTYRGLNIHDLAEHSTFEEVVYLLWFGALPTRKQLDELSSQLAANRALPEEVLAMMRTFPGTVTPMEALRTVISALSMYDPDVEEESREANLRKAVRLTARMPTIVATYHRLRKGEEPMAPNPALRHAANFLYMLSGQVPDEVAERAFDVALVLLADHGFNASTFAARVTAATLSDIYSAITSAIGTLKGPLHGGANQRAMEMMLEIGEIENVEGYIKAALAARKRIMGFGHRVYKTEDPRATELRQMACRLGERMGNMKWCDMAQRIQEVVWAEKQLYPNVDFYTAPTLYTLGIPPDLFTPLFACSRVAGWTAHVLEQYSDNRLIRPRAKYVGPRDQPYVPIEDRGEA
ncbi:MAG: citrate/2-methylcitrate synthase [Anaerolineae bacterium]